MFKRVAVSAVAATALAGATAGQASAQALPVCVARLAAPATGPTASCVFAENSGYAEINVVPVATTVTATVRCFGSGGYTTSRTVSGPTTFFTYAPGSCNLELSSSSPTAVAIATASPWFPIEG